MPMIVNGIGVARGVAQGPACVLRHGLTNIVKRTLGDDEIEPEIARLEQARDNAKQQLQSTRELVPAAMREEIGSFIDSHLLMLDDVLLTETPSTLIRTERCNAEWALQQTMEQLTAVFEQMDDAYLRTRRNDVEQVIQKIQKNLAEDAEDGPEHDLTGRIVVADDLTPADTVELQNQNIAAFVTALGSPMSHTAILARSLGIPAIVGIHDSSEFLRDGDLLLVDGRGGTVLSATDDWLIDQYREYQREEQEREESLMQLRQKPAVTRDRRSIALKCNVDLVDEVDEVHEVGGDGVGLYRTEFFYLNREQGGASSDEQYETYRDLVLALDGKPLTIRTLDLGADKEFDPDYEGAIAPNPALGLRAIRRSLQDKPNFLAQLRAILRASAHGPIEIMLPMLTNSAELSQSIILLDQCKEQLSREDIPYDPSIRLGGMIEVPAAAICAELFAQQLDFLSIGTNDLIQYTLAIDRVDDQVNYLFDPLHPAILHLIRRTIQAGERTRTPVSMCGEMASAPNLSRLLLGLGLREFSTHPNVLLEIKHIITSTSAEAVRTQCEDILQCERPEQIRDKVEAMNQA